ncbi:MAG: LEA type 2 family protein [Gammaproteobacteria bacterium]
MKMRILSCLSRLCLLALLAVMPVSCAMLQQVVKKPTVQVQKVAFHSLNMREGQLDSHLQISNPNAFALPVRELTYQLKLNGHALVEGKLKFDKQIPARGMLYLALPLRFQYQQVINGLDSILQQHQINFQLTGEVNLDLVHIPFSKSGQFKLAL